MIIDDGDAKHTVNPVIADEELFLVPEHDLYAEDHGLQSFWFKIQEIMARLWGKK
jgi:hypothetical protein